MLIHDPDLGIQYIRKNVCFLGGSSSSDTTTKTNTSSLSAQGTVGTVNEFSAGSNVTTTDAGAINAATQQIANAFNFANSVVTTDANISAKAIAAAAGNNAIASPVQQQPAVGSSSMTLSPAVIIAGLTLGYMLIKGK